MGKNFIGAHQLDSKLKISKVTFHDEKACDTIVTIELSHTDTDSWQDILDMEVKDGFA